MHAWNRNFLRREIAPRFGRVFDGITHCIMFNMLVSTTWADKGMVATTIGRSSTELVFEVDNAARNLDQKGGTLAFLHLIRRN